MRSHKLRFGLLALLAVVLVSAVMPAFAQEATAEPDPNARITFPPPVYVLRGETEIRGSANLPGITNYFLEFRALNEALEPVDEDGEETEFIPATLPRAGAVQDDVLGVWDTTSAPDGIYELRLTVNTGPRSATRHIVTPLRIENEPNPFAPQATAEATDVAIPTSTPAPTLTSPPTQPPAPTAAPTTDPTPRVTATRNSNVRTGDGVNYPAIASLAQGQSALVLGISNRGTGWYQIRLDNGTVGWISPTVVTPSGNLATVPSVAPPPPPATPTPTFTPTPATQVNLVAGVIQLNPAQPQCNQVFQVGFDVANLGTQASPAGTVGLVDTRTLDGQVTTTATGSFPSILPGQTVRVNISITVTTFFNESHRLILTIDPGGQIAETNEADNVRQLDYNLPQGSCGSGGSPTGANLVAGNINVNPFPPTCLQNFTVSFDVANLGNANAPGGTVRLRDIRAADGSVQVEQTVNFPDIAQGTTTAVVFNLTVSTWVNETHRLVLTIDPGSGIPESNEGDNERVLEYVLQRGACP